MLFAAEPQSLTYNQFVDITQTPQEFLLPALGLLSVTTEWGQRTGLVTFTPTPQRGAAIFNLLGEALRHGNGSWAFGLGGFRDIVIVQLSGLAEGFAFGVLLLMSATAIITYYVLPTLVAFAVSTVSSLKADKSWFDLISAQSPLYTHDMTVWAAGVRASPSGSIASNRTVPPNRTSSVSSPRAATAPFRLIPMISTLREARPTRTSIRSNELRERRSRPADTAPATCWANSSSRASIRCSRPRRSSSASTPRKPKNPKTICRSETATPNTVGSRLMTTADITKMDGMTVST